jgi:hypothetical protein
MTQFQIDVFNSFQIDIKKVTTSASLSKKVFMQKFYRDKVYPLVKSIYPEMNSLHFISSGISFFINNNTIKVSMQLSKVKLLELIIPRPLKDHFNNAIK